MIFSGGDPLIVSARRLAEVTARLAAISHVKVIRLHTRVPVVAPERVTPALTRALRVRDKATFVALHINHPRELTEAARAACARLIDAGIPMLSQSVLLRGVNDDAETLGALMRALVECRIKPYYLHHGDLAPGTAHLRTGIAEGQALMRALRGRYSGLCQPSYVLDIPGGYGKSPIGPSYLSATVPARSAVGSGGFPRTAASTIRRADRRFCDQPFGSTAAGATPPSVPRRENTPRFRRHSRRYRTTRCGARSVR